MKTIDALFAEGYIRFRREPWSAGIYVEVTPVETPSGKGYGPWVRLVDPASAAVGYVAPPLLMWNIGAEAPIWIGVPAAEAGSEGKAP